ncbi:Aldo/keto reductase, partial [Aureobasidium sp. EXF-8845]
MKYVKLGESGLRISSIGVGCMSYGNPEAQFPWALREEEALPILQHCYKSGLNFFDTANVYANGDSEVLLGKAIKQNKWNRQAIVIASKVFFTVGFGVDQPLHQSDEEKNDKGYVNQYGLSRKHIFESVENSLKRLDLDYIDLLQIHRFD